MAHTNKCECCEELADLRKQMERYRITARWLNKTRNRALSLLVWGRKAGFIDAANAMEQAIEALEHGAEPLPDGAYEMETYT